MIRAQELTSLLILMLGCEQLAAFFTPTCDMELVRRNIWNDCITQVGDVFQMDIAHMEAAPSKLLNAACENKESVQSMLECGLRYADTCLPEEYKSMWPEKTKLAKLMDTVCAHASYLSFDCVRNSVESLDKCIISLEEQLSSSIRQNRSLTETLCKTYEWNVECLSPGLKACGCATLKTFQALVIDVLHPSVCPAIRAPRVQCDRADPQLYTDNGGQQHSGWAVSVFVSSLLVLFLYCAK